MALDMDGFSSVFSAFFAALQESRRSCPSVAAPPHFFCKATELFPRNCAAETEPGKEDARIKQVHKNLE
ncbi:MAG TPA: hypothetical protein DD429_01250 [Clostridiaceae bacterium]|nr:hypothetical protein [Clostridiaceae bacterium]